MANDTLADVLTRIRNAQRVYHPTVMVSGSRLATSVLNVLKKEGYIDSFDKEVVDGFDQYKVFLKYNSEGEPIINTIRKVSTPGRRQYARSRKLPRISSGLGICIVSTSQGVMTDREARSLGIGGELLATVV